MAYNDHAATNSTHVNATRWNVFGTANGAPGASGALKNIQSGANLPATLTIVNSGASAAGTQGTPASGTPAYTVFNGFVDFRGTPSPSVELETGDVVTYTFSGLDQAKKYNFIGSAVRGDPTYVNRWTLVQIQAASFVAAHTPNVLTSNQVPAILPTQAAINTGVNHTANTGDYTSWDQIQPNANGTIVITCQQYVGTVPGGAANGPRGYSITGIRLEELSSTPTPVAILSQSGNQAVNAGAVVTIGVSVTGSSPRFQWYKNGTLLPTRTNQTITFNPITIGDSGSYSVIVTNSLNSVTSAPIVVTATIPPIVYTNLGLTNVSWKYYAQGNEPAPNGGVNWKQTNYSDAAWASGPGILAQEDLAALVPRINTVLSLNDGGGNRIITYYFRNQFVLTNEPSAVTLSMSNYIDDGAVVYLNGTEVWRYNMSSGTPTYGTFAPGTQTEGTLVGTNLPASLLIKGTNTIAVEVHQVNLTSSDVVFGMQVTTLIPPPSALSILSQPQSPMLVEEDKDAIFNIGLEGGDPNITWYKNGVAISNETRTTLTLPIVDLTNSPATYVFVATNIVNAVTSSPIVLVVYPDTNAPALLQADGTAANTNVIVTFSERLRTTPLASSITNTGNYIISNVVSGTTLAVSRVTLLPDGKSVSLHTAARTSGQNYTLTVRNLLDLAAPSGNPIPQSTTPIIQAITLMPMTAGGKYYNPLPNSIGGGDPVEIGSTWRNPGYDEATSGIDWADGASLFANGIDEPPVTIGTTLSQSRSFVDYYRMRFDSQNVSPGGLILSMNHIVDDGAIFYLNGQEVHRYNMQSGALSSNNTPANATVGSPGIIEVPISGSLIVTGQNVLAVSVHQAQYIDIDRAFGVEITARAQSFVVGSPMITSGPQDIWVTEGQTATFSVTSLGAFRFLWQSNNVVIAGATNSSYTTARVTTNMNGTLYRVSVSNSTAGLVSTNATLRVIADTNSPTVVSAMLSSNNTILVSFSEPLLGSSVTPVANYSVVNNGTGNVAVSTAALQNSTNVVLSFGGTLAGRYTITMNNIADASSQTNKIAPNTIVNVGAEYSIGMVSPWKYLLISTNEEIQETYFETTFNDSGWSGPSNSLFYVEESGLPFTKSTALVTNIGPDRINTFYFRKNFVAPIGGTNATFRIRHVLDDGMVLYLNGREIYRYNMPSGSILASSQAAANIGTATLLGPFDIIVTNLVGGTNIFAAEVHQQGAASSDVVFGLELGITVPFSVITNRPVQIVTQPRNQTNLVGTVATFTVVATGSTPIYYQWRSNNVPILNATSASYNLNNVQLTDDGKQFSVVVSNSINSVTSTVATLRVTNSCSPTFNWTNNFRLALSFTNGMTNLVLSWTNPVVDTCNSTGVVVLRRAPAITAPSMVWSNIFTNTAGPARVVVPNVKSATTNGFYRIFVQ